MRVTDLERKVLERTAELADRTLQLEERTKQLEGFSYSVSHDLRAPLRAISGFAHILLQRHSERLDDKGKHCLDNIVEASAHMSHLIDDLLTYSRLGREAVPIKPIELEKVFQSIEKNLANNLEPGSLSFAPDLPTVLGDRTLLSQIFSNLIDNALKYLKPGCAPKVTVTCEMDHDFVKISVADNGIGIDSRQFEKIFEVFQRLHGQDQYPGTGIGLSVVRRACELLDGSVSVESAVGVGSIFHVRLPLPRLPDSSQLQPGGTADATD